MAAVNATETLALIVEDDPATRAVEEAVEAYHRRAHRPPIPPSAPRVYIRWMGAAARLEMESVSVSHGCQFPRCGVMRDAVPGGNMESRIRPSAQPKISPAWIVLCHEAAHPGERVAESNAWPQLNVAVCRSPPGCASHPVAGPKSERRRLSGVRRVGAYGG
jgi:hypothetical protein